MKSKLFFIIPAVIILSSCAPTTFYQVYKAVPDEDIVEQDDYLVYEDENCEVSYNLWEDGGNSGFVFHNKSDEMIYLNMEESFFLKNGFAHDYYKNRVFTNSQSLGVSASNTTTGYNYFNIFSNYPYSTNKLGSTASSEQSVSYGEKKIIRIPAGSAKIITEFNISESLFRDCDLLKYPKKEKDIFTMKFDKSDSPMVFSNRLVYTLGYSVEPITIDNEFYVSEITNYPKDMMEDSINEEFCGQKSTVITNKLKYLSPYHFYFIYKKGTDIWKY